MEPIIKSMLDDDLYKFTMCQAVISKFPAAKAKYEFINRGDAKFTQGFLRRLKYSLADLSTLRMSKSEILFLLDECPFLRKPFIEWLDYYRYDLSDLSIRLSDEGQLSVTIVGPWYRTILWEVKLMALISEAYFADIKYSESDVCRIAALKAHQISEKGLQVIDFGTRRRFSHRVHDLVLDTMHTCLAGTSNLSMAMKYGLPVVGTMAHEWIMAHAAQAGYLAANHSALVDWEDVYKKDLSVALTDTYTSDVFFNGTAFRAPSFDGLRQDSGDPIAFIDKAIEFYNRHCIDPLSKKIVFSDSLDVNKAEEIAAYCKGKINCIFGIGTNLTNDMRLVKPLNMVIKMTAFAPDGMLWHPTVKLSDDPGKHTGYYDEVDRCKSLLSISSGD